MCFNHNPQYKLHQRQQFFSITVQEAIIPDPAKALGQNMLQHQPQKVFALEDSVLRVARFPFGIAVRHLACLIGNDILFADNAAVQVARQVRQSRFPFPDMPAIHDPFVRPISAPRCGVKAKVFQGADGRGKQEVKVVIKYSTGSNLARCRSSQRLASWFWHFGQLRCPQERGCRVCEAHSVQCSRI